MDQEKTQLRIQLNQKLKDVTWKESGIPTLTQPVASNLVKKKEAFDDLILDFDEETTNENGHKIDCSCKKCVKKPLSHNTAVLSAMKADPCIRPLNKKRY